jgi:arylsulfatase A-like enzyme
MCYLFDVLPTLGKICDVPPPETSEGLELTAVLAEPSRAARPHLMFAYKNAQRAVRNDRWKLIRFPLIDRTLLFDLQTDPQETTNLADHPEHADKVAELRVLLEEEQLAFGDSAPLTVADPQPAEWMPPR